MNGLYLVGVVAAIARYMYHRVHARREEPSYLDTMRTLSQKDRRNSR